MKLIVQPQDGVAPLLEGITRAKDSIEITIFRFDYAEIREALEAAVARGVSVHALIANTGHGSEHDLRRLEMDLLPAGIEVSRTADDFLRHHYKFMIVDRSSLYVFTFNFTYLDIDNSRSFGLITRDRELVAEAVRLFRADIRRQPFETESKTFLVSPVNARPELATFIRAAEKQLLIYDPEVSDRPMINLLRERARAGVEIRIIGRVSKPTSEVSAGRLMRMRFHTRTIIRDEKDAFLGSQSLREAELDRRRELGLITNHRAVITSLLHVFGEDWAAAEPARHSAGDINEPLAGKRVLKALVRDLPLAPAVASALKHAATQAHALHRAPRHLSHELSDALKVAVEDAVSRLVRRPPRSWAVGQGT